MKLVLLGFVIGMAFYFIASEIAKYFCLDLTDFIAWLISQPIIFIKWLFSPLFCFKAAIFWIKKGHNPWSARVSDMIALNEEDRKKFLKTVPKKWQKNVKILLDKNPVK